MFSQTKPAVPTSLDGKDDTEGSEIKKETLTDATSEADTDDGSNECIVGWKKLMGKDLTMKVCNRTVSYSSLSASIQILKCIPQF